MAPRRSKAKQQKNKDDPYYETATVLIKCEPETQNAIEYKNASDNLKEASEDIFDDYRQFKEESESEEDAPASSKAPKVRGKTKTRYSPETLKKAVESVRSGKMNCYRASKVFKVPHATIIDHVRADKVYKKAGAETIFKQDEEQQLVEYINETSELSYPRTSHDLREAAADLVKMLNKPGFRSQLPSRKWVGSFLSRHPNVKLRTAKDNFVSDSGFNEKFHKFIEDNGLNDLLTRKDAFYIVEDTNFEFLDKPPDSERRLKINKMLASRISASHLRKNSATVTYTFSAEGRMVRPLIIFKNGTVDMLKIAVADQELDGKFLFSTTSDSGHTNESFKAYLMRLDQDLKNVARPIFFFCADTLPRIDLETFQFLQKSKIHVISFIPKDVSILRACSEDIFGMNNTGWSEIVKKSSTEGKISHVDFMKALVNIHQKYFEKEIIQHSFKQSCIFPFNNIEDERNEIEERPAKIPRIESSVNNAAKVLEIVDQIKVLNEQLRESIKSNGLHYLALNTTVIRQQLRLVENSCGRRASIK